MLILSSTKLALLVLPLSAQLMKMPVAGGAEHCFAQSSLSKSPRKILFLSSVQLQPMLYQLGTTPHSPGGKGLEGVMGTSTWNRSVDGQTEQVPWRHSFTPGLAQGRTEEDMVVLSRPFKNPFFTYQDNIYNVHSVATAMPSNHDPQPPTNHQPTAPACSQSL